jgi:YD repeat-containing protein
MATRKKKTEVVEIVPPTATVVVKGSHLTVTTFPDGTTKLEWDDAALLKEVQDAILSVELAAMKPAVRAKVSTRKKKESNV